ncbi:MAG: hypothetical protein A2847_00545 [Candidatus Sungbacteria bacterium RIFCSPHIGHO2_01_FULL_50_25]|uniref:Solute-binding protein family 5 domain-containing protein n=1 Tax=Candidatus Sungbacteria bacterium RIFCSPHIGHO2_01_FULL_50_25 TaxID=1802265 RepID=A0A1G2K802_9BACT|nr:MAG: hypothetical protein A2847_00545 [Candidatus Sungbacteria bacterium RIFCSPHIGHO2_01_FULL_50_25]
MPDAVGYRWLRLHKLLHIPRFLDPRDQRRVYLVFIACILFGVSFFARVYIRLTLPVPALGGAYHEGLLKTPRAINPVYASTNDTDRDFAKLVFSRILTYDGNGNIVLDLAKQYEMSADGKTYMVTLRENAYWHDGKKVTAEDVLFTISMIQNPSYKSPFIANWQGVEIKKIDEYTVQFTLRTPYVPFLENLTVGILPRHIWKDVRPEQALLHEQNLQPIGSGPYRFDRFIKNDDGTISEYRFAWNPDYYREGPYIRRLTFTFYDSFEMLLTDWRKGKIDGMSPISKNIENELNENRHSLFSIETPRVFGIFFNQSKNDALRDKRIREAIARAISRDAITDYILGEATSKSTPFPRFGETEPRGDTPTSTIVYDPGKARTLLAEAGYKDENGDGILERKEKKKSGNKTIESETPLSFVLTTSDWPDLLRAAEKIQRDLAAVGIDIQINTVSLSELDTSVIRPRDFEILLFGHAYGYEPDPFLFWHTSQGKDPGLNIVRYSDKTSDRLLEEIRTLPDRGERERRLRELEKRIMQELPMLPIFSEEYLYILPRRIKGIDPKIISLQSDRFNEVNRWYIDTKRIFK